MEDAGGTYGVYRDKYRIDFEEAYESYDHDPRRRPRLQRQGGVSLRDNLGRDVLRSPSQPPRWRSRQGDARQYRDIRPRGRADPWESRRM